MARQVQTNERRVQMSEDKRETRAYEKRQMRDDFKRVKTNERRVQMSSDKWKMSADKWYTNDIVCNLPFLLEGVEPLPNFQKGQGAPHDLNF